MGKFYAWAITGQVTGLEAWLDAESPQESEAPSEEGNLVYIATRMLKQQKFRVHSRDGRHLDVHLVESGIALENGQFATVAWASREGAQHGHCVFVQNHSTGGEARLESNLKFIRSEVNSKRIASFGLLAATPAAFAILGWLLRPGSLADVDVGLFLVGASVALALLFAVGATVAKLVLDYLRSEDDEKIWSAVNKALTVSYQQSKGPVSRLPQLQSQQRRL